MTKNKFGEIVFSQHDLCDLVMRGHDVACMFDVKIDRSVDVQKLIPQLENPAALLTWALPEDSNIDVAEFDRVRQNRWFMPQEYQDLDIAQYVVDLCQTDAERQRAAQELLLFYDRDLFDLLKYLKYLVDVMKSNHVIWGVGRGSSVASYVLYLLGVHRINNMYYDLDPKEFLR
jgi:hypothetical protein